MAFDGEIAIGFPAFGCHFKPPVNGTMVGWNFCCKTYGFILCYVFTFAGSHLSTNVLFLNYL